MTLRRKWKFNDSILTCFGTFCLKRYAVLCCEGSSTFKVQVYQKVSLLNLISAGKRPHGIYMSNEGLYDEISLYC